MKRDTFVRTGWLLSLILMVALVACGPATPSNEANGAEDTAVNNAENTADSNAADPAAPEAETAEDDFAGMLEPPTPAASPTPIEGALTTDSGLQYVEVEAGSGAMPEEGDIVEIHFSGELADGTPIGDSYSRGEPLMVVLGTEQLLPGWEEGLLLMQEGGTAKLVIPPAEAFGEAGGGGIPPNATVIIDVELLSVSPPPQPTAVDEDEYTTTDSGLQYYDIRTGDGETPDDGDSVTVDFTIWVAEGEEFIVSSEMSGGPLTFTVGAGDVVFPGWDEGVSTMEVGGVRQLVIPSELGFGAQSVPGVPPNSALLMEVELLSLTEPPEITEVPEEDYTTTDSGLQYYDLVEGDGEVAETGDTVEVHYTGWLTDGTVFDSSLERGQTFSFALGTGSVIPGWDEGVAGMEVGGKRQLVIPPELGYGAQGAGAAIPPNATLIFEVELIDVIPAE